MSLLFSLLAFALILSPVVFVHELGHYLMARAFGVQVEIFSVGFGPSLWSYTSKKTGTLWKIGIIPLGGYAKFSGDENAASSVHAVVEKKDPKSPLITHKAPWQVALIGFAGPLANYILAFVLMFGVLIFMGKPLHDPVLNVRQNSLGYMSGLRSGQRVLAFDQYQIKSFQDIVEHLKHKPKNQEISLLVETESPEKQDGKSKESDIHISDTKKDEKSHGSLKIITIKNEKSARDVALEVEGPDPRLHLKTPMIWKDKTEPKESWFGTLGIEPQGTVISYESVSKGEALSLILKTMNPIYSFSGINSTQDLKRFKGPIGILERAGDVIKTDFGNVLMFMALLSFGLGFFNLIPLPLLDGGRILMSAIEMVIGRPLSMKLQEALSFGAMLFIGAFFLYISWNDLLNLKALTPFFSFLGLK